MSKLTYIKLLNKTLEYYLKGEFEIGYNYISKNKDKVKGNRAQIYNFQYTLACKLGNIEKGMELLKEAVYEKGYWYASDYLQEDDDLQELRSLEEFNNILKICKKREKEAKANVDPELEIYFPIEYSDDKTPLFISVHGNQENINIVKNYWGDVTQYNYILALPQSSQIEFSDAYDWNDLDKGASEIKEHYNNIKGNYLIDKEDIIMGGFSAGVRVILETIKKRYIEPQGLILMAPWIPEIEKRIEIFDLIKELNTKLYILCGDNDKDCFEDCNMLVQKLEKYNIPYKYDVIENLDHDYPMDFKQKLKTAIDYIRS